MPDAATGTVLESAADVDALLAPYEFTPTAMQCECSGCHGCGNQKCVRTAVFCVRVHAIGQCTDPDFADTDGYAVQFCCHPCMTLRAARIAELFNQSHKAKRTIGHYLQCVPCGRDLIDTKDFWETRAI
jgi:hypothetical protein